MVVKNIAVLFSGNGSNLQAILEQVHGHIFEKMKINVSLLITNNPLAGGIERAKEHGLNSVVINHNDFGSRDEFDAALVGEIKKHEIDLCVLAGFMRVLGPVFTSQIRAINLHPSILPLFKGANAIRESFESDMQLGGVSVHWVSDELDGGKIISQRAFKRKKMTLPQWEAKIHEIEHALLPSTIVKVLKKDEDDE